MDRLEHIKNEVIQEDGNYRDWESYMDDQPYGASDYMVNEVARRYATEMVRHNLERAAESARIGVVVPKELEDAFDDLKDGDIDISVDPERLKGCKLRVSKQSITSLEIELI